MSTGSGELPTDVTWTKLCGTKLFAESHCNLNKLFKQILTTCILKIIGMKQRTVCAILNNSFPTRIF